MKTKLRNSKKAEISGQVVIYVLSLVIFGAIVIYGYSAIQNFTKDQEKIAYLKFEEDFKSTVKSLVLSYGDVEVFNDKNPLKIPTGYDKMCIVDLNVNYPTKCGSGPCFSIFDSSPLLHDSWQSKVQTNVFMLQGDKLKQSFLAGNITVGVKNIPSQRWQCFNVVNGRINNMKLEGVGARANITNYP